ncbi:MAG TPA: class I SAM-dependent methyltransferase [Patescibacteria group bacterium]|nr:class I SAM-dependent methyltransferase [Patescibacteria group bacterium]
MSTSSGHETPAEALARLYDLDLHDDPGDLDLWSALAAQAGGPVLELMAGSGRVAIPLAEEGHVVTAVDLDAAMLGRARRRAEAAGTEVDARVTLVAGDVTASDLGLGRRFRLAFIALNSILLLPGRAAQRAAWETLAAHLAPGGVAAVDAWLPDAHDLARYDGRLHLEYYRPDPETGRWVTKMAAAQHDAATQTVALTTIYEEGEPGEPASRWVRRDVVRLVTADELRAMAEAAGLEVELLAGGYDLEPLGPHDDRAIVIARMPGSGGHD